MAALEPGDPRQVGRYRLLSRLGQGGMGRVFLAASPAGRAVAIKMVWPALAGDPAFRARFRAEVEAARKVSGAFTSPVVDAEPDAAVPWLATAYVNGPSLRDAVARHGPLPERMLRTLGAGLGEALAAVHRAGLLHRDLTPANVLLAADGPKIIDFGISRAADGTGLTAEGAFVGTPGYMAPERFHGEDPDPAVDVFAFGAVMAFAATGRPPFGNGPVQTKIYRTLHEQPDLDGVPPSLAAMVAACLSTDPARRPPAALLPRLPGAPPAEPGWLPGAIDREVREHERTLVMDLRDVVRRRTRRRLLAGGAAVAGLALAGGGTAAALAATDRSRRVPPPPRFLWQVELPKSGDIAVPFITAHGVFVLELFTKAAVSYDVSTGRRLWSETMNNATVDKDLVYAQRSRGGDLVAIDPASRANRWTAALPSGYDVRDFYGPTGGLLALGDGDGTVLCHDARTGRRLWAYRGADATGLRGIQGGSLIAASGDEGESREGTVLGLDTATGAVRWSRTYGNTRLARPERGDLLFGSQAEHTLDAISAATGRTVWSADLPDAAGDLSESTPVVTVANGTAYLGGRALYALDLATGRRKWAYEPPAPGGDHRTFLVERERAYVFDDHKLVALDARTGRRLWSAATPADDTAPLLAAGGLVCTVAAGVTGPGFYGWDAVTGKLVWRHPPASSNTDDQWVLTSTGPFLVALQNAALVAFRLA
ncbi:serine/threonine-protein kinase [Actinomadura verrucosospora]|uniref:Serine/threonine protein kinase n=1 Tax=Actinomadura verrucosospora TaxID=46165 RepID=A0A7D3VSN9_ACTVE|nr:serine/threonine-protein kinase [Actinomadura verrucosospora]QKG21553.1 serine/threonine protein kinase [Actinomadura verrucosospora]